MRETPQYDQSNRGLQILREDLTRRFAALPALAFSTDGSRFHFTAPTTSTLVAGRLVIIKRSNGLPLFGQIETAEVHEFEGLKFGVRYGDRGQLEVSSVLSHSFLQAGAHIREIRGEGKILEPGESTSWGKSAGPFDDSDIRAATAKEIKEWLHREEKKVGYLLSIGRLAEVDEGEAVAHLLAAGFNRHSFLCGQSGAGKTRTVATLLDQILLKTELRMVIIDPNSDFVRLGDPWTEEDLKHAEEAKARKIKEKLQAAGMSKDESERVADGRASQYGRYLREYAKGVEKVRVLKPRPKDGSPLNGRDLPLALHLNDLRPAELAAVLRIDPIKDRDEYDLLRESRADGSRSRSLDGLLDDLGKIKNDKNHRFHLEAPHLESRILNLGLRDWPIWAREGEKSLGDRLNDNSIRCVVIDIGALETAEQKMMVASAVLRMLLDSHIGAKPEDRESRLVVIDEAHNVCVDSPRGPIETLSTEHVVRIAAEGRKYGLFLLMATQRPNKIHINALSQCENLFLMKMNSNDDLTMLGRVFSRIPTDVISRARSFAQGEALIFGGVVPAPISLIVRFGDWFARESGGDLGLHWAGIGKSSSKPPA